jgi:hypothetical protein
MEDVYYADGGHYIEHALTFEDNTMPDARQSQEFAAKSHKYGQRRSSPQHGRVAHDRSSWMGASVDPVAKPIMWKAVQSCQVVSTVGVPVADSDMTSTTEATAGGDGQRRRAVRHRVWTNQSQSIIPVPSAVHACALSVYTLVPVHGCCFNHGKSLLEVTVGGAIVPTAPLVNSNRAKVSTQSHKTALRVRSILDGSVGRLQQYSN